MLRPATAAGALLVASLIALMGLNGTVAAMSSTSQRPELSVTNKTSAADTGLMPGGSAIQLFSVSAATDVVYAMDVSVSGSHSLADELTVRVEGSLTGETLYHGPLTTARFDQRTLPAGVAEEVLITVTMPASVGDALSGASVGAKWSFQATPVSAP